MNESFVLVELPNVLYAGFYWTLKQLQDQAKGTEVLAFCNVLASSSEENIDIGCPQYASDSDFAFDLSLLHKDRLLYRNKYLVLKPKELILSEDLQKRYIDNLCDATTLDHGQANALCFSLCRSLAFTQGPPGTGKT